MKTNTKNRIVTIGFAIILILVLVANIITKDKEISLTERRRLAQFPETSIQQIFNGNLAKMFDEYSVDQFILRDLFRSIKAYNSILFFNQKDDNKLFVKDDRIYKMEYPLNSNNVQKSANKINEIYTKYLKNMNVYYSIIPDKNYYIENDDHLKMDYSKLISILNNTLSEMKYIDIIQSLELDDYYRTDLHWRQEKLNKVVDTIRKNMDLNDRQNIYETKDIGEYYGTYYGQLGIKVMPDDMYILTNNVLEKCTAYNLETGEYEKIYSQKKKTDKYDVYLSGATPLITIENPESNTEKELLLFRDSFGSCLAPLLVQDYKKITLVDIRYISSKLLNQYIEFNNQDVLFLYSSIILNQNIFK